MMKYILAAALISGPSLFADLAPTLNECTSTTIGIPCYTKDAQGNLTQTVGTCHEDPPGNFYCASGTLGSEGPGGTTGSNSANTAGTDSTTKGCNAISSPSLLLSIASLLSGLALVARRKR